MNTETMYWLFTTAPQTIGALVGIICTGMFYMAGIIDNRAKEEPSLYEIEKKKKKTLYDDLRIVVILAVITIIYDVVLIYLTPKLVSVASCLKCLVFLLFISLNFLSVLGTVIFVFRTVDPGSFDRMAKKIGKDFAPGDVEQKEFISHYMQFEREARRLPFIDGNKTTPTREIIRELAAEGIISKEDLKEMWNIARLRNVIVHGQYDEKVDKTIDEKLQQITKQVKQYSEDTNL